MKTPKNQQESAQTLALRALAWLLADEELTGLFLGATGASPADLRARAQDAPQIEAKLGKEVEGFCCKAPSRPRLALLRH